MCALLTSYRRVEGICSCRCIKPEGKQGNTSLSYTLVTDTSRSRSIDQDGRICCIHTVARKKKKIRERRITWVGFLGHKHEAEYNIWRAVALWKNVLYLWQHSWSCWRSQRQTSRQRTDDIYCIKTAWWGQSTNSLRKDSVEPCCAWGVGVHVDDY